MSYKVIDVREPGEYKLGHVEGALNIPVAKIKTSKEIKALAKDQKIIVYCASGGRSAMVHKTLVGMGYEEVINGTNKSMTERFLYENQ